MAFLSYKTKTTKEYATLFEINPDHFLYKSVEECIQADDLEYFKDTFGESYFTEDSMSVCAKYNAKQILQFLNEIHQIPTSTQFFVNALQNNHMDLYKTYIHQFLSLEENRVEYLIIQELTAGNHEELVHEILESHECDFPIFNDDDRTLTECLKNNNIELANYCVSKGCQSQKNTYVYTASIGSLGMLEWILQHANENYYQTHQHNTRLKEAILHSIKCGHLGYFIRSLHMVGGLVSFSQEYINYIIHQCAMWCFQVEHQPYIYEKEWNTFLFYLPDTYTKDYPSLLQFIEYRKEKKILQSEYVSHVLPNYIEKDVCKYIILSYL